MQPRRVLRFPLLAAIVVPVVLAGCASLEEGARDHFVRALACPAERVTVKARPDLRYGDLIGAPTASAPPAEVAADPERLALWKEQRARAQADGRANANARYDVFEVSGCGHTAQLGCRHPEDERGRTELGAVTCATPRPLAPTPGE
jgi:hypothetical protein